MSVVSPASPTWHISRIPIYDDHVDNIVGYVLKDDVLAQLLARNGTRPLNDLKRPMVSVDSGETLIALHRRLIKAHEHIAIVKQEGRTVGVVTMEDVIEEFLGQEIVDESDLARGVVD